MTAPTRPTCALLDVTSRTGVPFRFVYYPPGSTGPYPAARDADRALVEVYDRRYRNVPENANGQFTGARYYVTTLLAPEDRDYGLILAGGIDEWTVDAATMRLVREWLALTDAAVPA